MLEHEQGAERVDAEGQQGVVGVDLTGDFSGNGTPGRTRARWR